MFFIKANKKVGETTLNGAVLEEATSIIVTSATGIVVGQTIVMTDAQFRVYVGMVTSIASAPTIDLDTPLNIGFDDGIAVNFGTNSLDVNGSITPQIFSLKNIGGAIPVPIDVTTIAISCISATAIDLNKFGDLAALTNGIVIRQKNSQITNYFNFKKNLDFTNVGLFTPYDASNPGQGVFGFTANIQLNGLDHFGSVIRVDTDCDIEIIIQDDLTALTELEIVLSGHVVTP